jgi:hypothetical protein
MRIKRAREFFQLQALKSRFVITAILIESYRDLFSFGLNITHLAYLLSLFIQVLLIDANSIRSHIWYEPRWFE